MMLSIDGQDTPSMTLSIVVHTHDYRIERGRVSDQELFTDDSLIGT